MFRLRVYWGQNGYKIRFQSTLKDDPLEFLAKKKFAPQPRKIDNVAKYSPSPNKSAVSTSPALKITNTDRSSIERQTNPKVKKAWDGPSKSPVATWNLATKGGIQASLASVLSERGSRAQSDSNVAKASQSAAPKPKIHITRPSSNVSNAIKNEDEVKDIRSKFSISQASPASFSLKSGWKQPVPTPDLSNGIDDPQVSEKYNRLKEYIAKKGTYKHQNPYDKVTIEAAPKPTHGKDKEKPKVSPVRTVVKCVNIPAEGLTYRDLSSKLSMKLDVLIIKVKSIEGNDNPGQFDVNALADNIIDPDIAELTVLELGFEVKRESSKISDDVSHRKRSENSTIAATEELLPRPPIVCIMGHVDHGKTTLLDTLRKANVASGEAGGITQKLSAFSVNIKDKKVVFLDTPGHEAFSSMRANGAMATDVAVIVIAFDDGVRPQTKEALKTAQEAGCQVLIALNKIDKIPYGERSSQREKIFTELTGLGAIPEEYGGDCPVVEVSGKTGEGLDNLIDILGLQSELLDLKAPVKCNGEAIVLEANLDKGVGALADVVVKWGTLRVGDSIVVGSSYGKIRALYDDKGKALKVAPPSTPCRILGLRTVPSAGQELIVVASELKAREIAERRLRIKEMRQQRVQQAAVDDSAGSSSQYHTSINVVVKADCMGTLEALTNLVTGIKSKCQNVSVNIVDSEIGNISNSDIERCGLAMNQSLIATCILGFNVGATETARHLAKEMDVKLFRENIIYRLEDSLTEVMSSLLPKETHYVDEGAAKVLKIFTLNDKSSTQIAGLEVTSGRLRTSNSNNTFLYRVRRGKEILTENLEADELRRFKDKVTEVDKGNECGLKLKAFQNLQVGDIIECVKVELKNGQLIMNKVGGR